MRQKTVNWDQWSSPQKPLKSLILKVVRERGVEPLRISPLDPKSSASASSATLARRDFLFILDLETYNIKPFPCPAKPQRSQRGKKEALASFAPWREERF